MHRKFNENPLRMVVLRYYASQIIKETEFR